MFFMNYFDVKNAVWDALSNDASPSYVMNRLTELASACFKKACEDDSGRTAEWFRADVYCQALRDGINGALFVRDRPTTPYAKRRAAEWARQRERERSQEILEVELGQEKTPSHLRARAVWDRVQAARVTDIYLRSAYITSAESHERAATLIEKDSADFKNTLADLEAKGIDPAAYIEAHKVKAP